MRIGTRAWERWNVWWCRRAEGVAGVVRGGAAAGGRAFEAGLAPVDSAHAAASSDTSTIKGTSAPTDQIGPLPFCEELRSTPGTLPERG
jgi:hypothetical protein